MSFLLCTESGLCALSENPSCFSSDNHDLDFYFNLYFYDLNFHKHISFLGFFFSKEVKINRRYKVQKKKTSSSEVKEVL